jgi:hypothetical protein
MIDGLDGVVGLALGLVHSCALRHDGRVLCWGDGEAGMLGDGLESSRPKPAPVVGLSDVVRITARNLHTCALRAAGTVHCWGLGDSGQLGDGKARPTDGHSAQPVEVSGITGAADIAAGNAHTCALVRSRVLCWGGNGVGQLGDGTTTTRLAPVEVLDLEDVLEIAAGGGHQCALRANGDAFCWGAGAIGQTGQGMGVQTLRPARVPAR